MARKKAEKVKTGFEAARPETRSLVQMHSDNRLDEMCEVVLALTRLNGPLYQEERKFLLELARAASTSPPGKWEETKASWRKAIDARFLVEYRDRLATSIDAHDRATPEVQA